MVDNVTRTDIDLGQLGGPRKATAEMKGNQLITYLHKIEDDSIDVIAVRTINQATPNVMKYELKDLASGTDLIQTLNKQNWMKKNWKLNKDHPIRCYFVYCKQHTVLKQLFLLYFWI